MKTTLEKGDTVYIRRCPAVPVTLCWFEQMRHNPVCTPWGATAEGVYPILVNDIIKHEPSATPEALEHADSKWRDKLAEFQESEMRAHTLKETRHRMATHASKRIRPDALPEPEPHHHDGHIIARLEGLLPRLEAALGRVENLESRLHDQEASNAAQLTRLSDTLKGFQSVLNIRLQQLGARDLPPSNYDV